MPNILCVTEMIMKLAESISMKTLSVGIMTNYIQKNKGMAFARSLCNTMAKLAIKQNDK